jgi:hypothetical protein
MSSKRLEHLDRDRYISAKVLLREEPYEEDDDEEEEDNGKEKETDVDDDEEDGGYSVFGERMSSVGPGGCRDFEQCLVSRRDSPFAWPILPS